MTYVYCARFYIDSLFYRRDAHFKQEQCASLFFSDRENMWEIVMKGSIIGAWIDYNQKLITKL